MADDDGAPLVLLIDADRWARPDTARFLRFAGYRTLEAGDGRSGLHLARARQPDIVLLELVLPKLSGLEVLVALQAAPTRIPVIVDRLHLINGLGEALERFLLTNGSCLRQVTLAPTAEGSPAAPPEEAPHAPHLHRLAEASRQRLARRVEQYHVVHHLHARGVDVLHIAQAVGISRPTVYRSLRLPEPPQPKQAPRRRRALLDAHLPYLLRRWDEGCQNGSPLWAELCEQGFAGSSSTVFRAVARLRRQQRAGQRLNPLPPARRHLTVRQGAMLLLRRPADLTPRQRAARERLCALDPAIQTTYELAQAFARLLRERRGEHLDAWLAQVAGSGSREVHSFAAGLAKDAAVRAGLSEPWSNGQTEGHITKLKLLKRQGFGQAGFGLLPARALAIA